MLHKLPGPENFSNFTELQLSEAQTINFKVSAIHMNVSLSAGALMTGLIVS
jgi:hypothetical protein